MDTIQRKYTDDSHGQAVRKPQINHDSLGLAHVLYINYKSGQINQNRSIRTKDNGKPGRHEVEKDG